MGVLAGCQPNLKTRFFRPSGVGSKFFPYHPQLAPWAAFFRSFGAATFSVPDLKP
jgi:hypothetical protein